MIAIWLGATVGASACGRDAPAPTPSTPDPAPTAPAPSPTAAPVAPAASTGGLDPAWCGKVELATVTEVLGAAPERTHATVEPTASGERVRCDWERAISSIRISIYRAPAYWDVVVADDGGMYGEPFAAWTSSAARRGSPPTGFAYRTAGGGTVDVSVIGRRATTDEQLVRLVTPLAGVLD
ncbi:MAG: hypothetical protein R2939_15115 [Kofleriaceae bacterium]